MATTATITISDNNEFRKPGEERTIHISAVCSVGAVRSDVILYTVPVGYYFILRGINLFTSYVGSLPFILYDGDGTTYARVVVPTPTSTQFAPGFSFPGVPYNQYLRYALGDQEASKMAYVDIDGVLIPIPSMQM